MAHEILAEVFKRKKKIYCGSDLEDMLRKGGLAISTIGSIKEGIRREGYGPTSIAFNKSGRIIDWDQYPEKAIHISSYLRKTIRHRIESEHPREKFDLLFYDNILMKTAPCIRHRYSF